MKRQLLLTGALVLRAGPLVGENGWPAAETIRP